MTKQNSVTAQGGSGVSSGDEPVTEQGVSQEMALNTDAGDGNSEREVQSREQLAEQLRAELATKYENDISNVRSTLQKELAESKKEWERRESEYKQQMFELQTKGLPEEEVRALRLQAAEEEIQRLHQERSKLESALEQQSAVRNWTSYFEANGVTSDQLKVDGTLQELVNSGMSAITAQNAELKRKIAKMEGGQTETTEEVEMPSDPTNVSNGHILVKGKTGVVTKSNWPDLVKKYGSMERVYTLVEQGALSKDIIPD